MKALQQNVDCGTFKMDVLMTENQELFVGVSQFGSISSMTQNHAARQVKTILGKDYQLLKLKSDLHSQAVSVVPIEKVSIVLFELAKKGDTKAEFTLRMLLSLSITQLAYDAFGVKFNAIERANFITAFAQHNKQFHPLLTSWLKTDGVIDYGTEVNYFKLCAGLPIKPIKEYDDVTMAKMNKAEIEYNMLRKLGMTHAVALTHL